MDTSRYVLEKERVMATDGFIKGQLVSGAELGRVARARRSTYEVKKVPKAEVEIAISEGYGVERELKRDVRLVKPKENWKRFEDEIWLLLWKFGFSEMNGLDKLYIKAGERSRWNEGTDWKEVDVFGRADENVFIVECKSAEVLARRSLESTIIKITHFRERMRTSVRKHYEDSTIKVSFIIATQNIEWSESDEAEAKRYKIHIWRDKDVEYLAELARLYDLIGDAARYQLYGILFGDQKIKALEKQEIPAIRGKLGKVTYFSFLVMPEQLLRISYVHRRVGAVGPMNYKEVREAYQRLLKPTKLRSIHEFINRGEFFPNSVIINFREHPRFDVTVGKDLDFQYGVLTLPNCYGSAWIIDGQHRLYGYAKNPRRLTAPIPVIAFDRLPVSQQAKLFVDINQTQTKVDSNLLWDLAGDIYQDSEDEDQRERFIISHVVKNLDSMSDSPLKGRIFIPSVGKQTSSRNVTMRTICEAIGRNRLLERELLGRERERDDFARFVAERIAAFLRAVQNLYLEDWRKGDSGYLRSNNGISALFIVLRQVLKYLYVCEQQSIYTKSDTSEFEELATILLMPAMEYLKERPERSSEFRKRRGLAGQSESALELCQKIKEDFSDFPLPRVKLPDLPKDAGKAPPESVDQLIKDTELALREFILERLREAYGENWYRSGVPGGVKNAIKERLEEEYCKRPYRREEIEHTPEQKLEFADIGHLKDTIIYGNNWSLFENVFGNKKNVERHFADYIDLRNAHLAHPRKVDPVVWDKGRGAIKWIRKCLRL